MNSSFKRGLAIIGLGLATGASIAMGASPALAAPEPTVVVQANNGGHDQGGHHGEGDHNQGGWGNGDHNQGGHEQGDHNHGGWGDGDHGGWNNGGWGHSHLSHYRFVRTYDSQWDCARAGRRGEWRGSWDAYLCVPTGDRGFGNRRHHECEYALLVKRGWRF